jgi:succinate-acetate transporter protein
MSMSDSLSMGEKALMADPAPLGLAAFAFTTFLLSFANAGWLPASTASVVLPLAVFYGGMCQLFAGAFEMRKGNTFGFTAFCSYGGFWLFYALLVYLLDTKVIVPDASFGMELGAALILWGVFTFYMWIPAMFANTALNLTFLTLWLAFIALGIGNYYNITNIVHLGGYFGILAATFAAYTSFAIVTNSIVGPNTLPLGPGLKKMMGR